MASIQETAYPRLKHNPSSQDLISIYTPLLMALQVTNLDFQ
ncbi:MAG: hypothetical protein AAGG02_01205 [Cyanobacteria bacterium P01_H01_bin.15]